MLTPVLNFSRYLRSPHRWFSLIQSYLSVSYKSYFSCVPPGWKRPFSLHVRDRNSYLWAVRGGGFLRDVSHLQEELFDY